MKALLCACLLIAAPAFADEFAPALNRVDFQAEAGQEAANDQMNATLFVDLNNTDPATLARDMANAMNDGLKKAKDWPTVKVSSGSQQSWPVYGSGSAGANKLQGWRGHAELKLQTKDFKAAGALIASLQNSLQLGGVTFTVAEDSRHGLEASLTQQAIAAFRAKADLVREAWGAKGYRLVSMNISSAGGDGGVVRPMMFAKSMNAAAAPVAQDFSGGDSRLTVSVNGTIELQP